MYAICFFVCSLWDAEIRNRRVCVVLVVVLGGYQCWLPLRTRRWGTLRSICVGRVSKFLYPYKFQVLLHQHSLPNNVVCHFGNILVENLCLICFFYFCCSILNWPSIWFLRHKWPFQSCWETSSTSSFQTWVHHLLNDPLTSFADQVLGTIPISLWFFFGRGVIENIQKKGENEMFCVFN